MFVNIDVTLINEFKIDYFNDSDFTFFLFFCFFRFCFNDDLVTFNFIILVFLRHFTQQRTKDFFIV